MGPKNAFAKAAEVARAAKAAPGPPGPSTSSSSSSGSSALLAQVAAVTPTTTTASSSTKKRAGVGEDASAGAAATSTAAATTTATTATTTTATTATPGRAPVVAGVPKTYISKESLLDALRKYKSTYGARAPRFGNVKDRGLTAITKEVAEVFIASASSIYGGKLGEGESTATVLNQLVPMASLEIDNALSKIPGVTARLGGQATKEMQIKQVLVPISKYYRAALACSDSASALSLLSTAIGICRSAKVSLHVARDALGVSQYAMTKAGKFAPGTLPLRGSKPKTFPKRVSDDVLSELATFIVSPALSQPAEANAVNLRLNVLLTLTSGPEELFRLYTNDPEIRLKKLRKSSFLNIINNKNYFKAQTSETAACGLCAQSGHGMIEELEVLVGEVSGSIDLLLRKLLKEENEEVDEGDLQCGEIIEQQLRVRLRRVLSFLMSGYSKVCLQYSRSGAGESSTFTHCKSYATSDVHVVQLQCACSHDSEFNDDTATTAATAATTRAGGSTMGSPGAVRSSSSSDNVVWGAKTPLLSGDEKIPLEVFIRRTIPERPEESVKDMCAAEVMKYQQKKAREPDKPIPAPSKPKELIRCSGECRRGWRRKSIIGNEFQAPGADKKSKISFQTLIKPFTCRPCFAAQASDTHRMDCPDCNEAFWVINDISILVDHCESLIQVVDLPDQSSAAAVVKQSSSSSSSTAHLAEDEAATEIETMKERVLFWRYKIQRAENAVNAVLGHKFETVVEDAFFRNINLKLQYDQLSITRDYASKLFAKKAIEPVCQGGPAGIATDHVYFIKYMWPKNASASAVTQGTYRYGEDENRGHMTVIEDERGGEGDGNETNTDSTLARKGIFIHVFSPDTQQNSEKVICEDTAILELLGRLFPHVKVAFLHNDGAPNYTSTTTVQYFAHYFAKGKDSDADTTHPRIKLIGKHTGVSGEGKNPCDSEGGGVKKDAQIIVNKGISLQCAEEYCTELIKRQGGMAIAGRRRNCLFCMAEYDKSVIEALTFESLSGVQYFHYIEPAQGLFNGEQVDGLRFFKVSGTGSGIFIPNDCLKLLVTWGDSPSSSDLLNEDAAMDTDTSIGASSSSSSSSSSSGELELASSAEMCLPCADVVPAPVRSKNSSDLPRAYLPAELGVSIDDVTLDAIGGGKILLTHQEKSDKKLQKEGARATKAEEKRQKALAEKRMMAQKVSAELGDLAVVTYPCHLQKCFFHHTSPFLRPEWRERHYKRVPDHDPAYEGDEDASFISSSASSLTETPNTLTVPDRLVFLVKQRMLSDDSLSTGSALKSSLLHAGRHPPARQGTSPLAIQPTPPTPLAALLADSKDIKHWIVNVPSMEHTPGAYPYWESEFGVFVSTLSGQTGVGFVPLPLLQVVRGSPLFKCRRVCKGMFLYRVLLDSDTQTYTWSFVRRAPEPPLPGFALPKEHGDSSEKLDKLTIGKKDRKEEVVAWLRAVFNEPGCKVFPYTAWRRLQAAFPCPWDQLTEKQVASYFSTWNQEKKKAAASTTTSAIGGGEGGGEGEGGGGGGGKKKAAAATSKGKISAMKAPIEEELLNTADLNTLKNEQLKDLCRSMRIRVGGNKSELIARIEKRRAEQGEEAAGSGASSEKQDVDMGDSGESGGVGESIKEQEDDSQQLEILDAEENSALQAEYAEHVSIARWGDDCVADNLTDQHEEENEEEGEIEGVVVGPVVKKAKS